MDERKPVRVLCMEDDVGQARLLQRRLERLGYRVTLAANGEEGLALYDPALFDVITLDQHMPVLDGLEVLRRLKACGPLPPIIMVTGTGSESIAVEAMKMGACDYIVKDVEGGYLELLPTVIEQVLEQYRIAEEKRQADEALRHYADELENRNRELDFFAQTVAHDLRSPLSVVIGSLELVMNQEDTFQDRVKRLLTMALTKAHHMSEIIDALLLLASVRQEQVPLEEVDMGMVVAQVLARLESQIAEAQAQVSCPSTWPRAIGYAPWIVEIWQNYLTNAIKYGGQPPSIILGGEALSDGRARFWVRDNGQGIPSEKLAQLFTPFTRLDRTREGHGLGLAIVRHIAERLHGEVGVESTLGEGSTFSFILPGVQVNAEEYLLNFPTSLLG